MASSPWAGTNDFVHSLLKDNVEICQLDYV